MRSPFAPPPPVDAAGDERLRSAGYACGLMLKAAGDPISRYSLAGRLYLSKSGWGLLHVPNALVRGLFQAMQEPGAQLPLREGRLNAHISVFRPEDLDQIGGADKVTEWGKPFRYQLGPIQEVEPAGWKAVSKCWFVQVQSPELKQLRKSYGLTPLPCGDHEFHCTVATRAVGVLKSGPVSKAAAEGEDCPSCGAVLERDPSSGKCNSCGEPWPEKVAASATFNAHVHHEPVCPHCGEEMHEKALVPNWDRASGKMGPGYRHRGPCYDEGPFEIDWPAEKDAAGTVPLGLGVAPPPAGVGEAPSLVTVQPSVFAPRPSPASPLLPAAGSPRLAAPAPAFKAPAFKPPAFKAAVAVDHDRDGYVDDDKSTRRRAPRRPAPKPADDERTTAADVLIPGGIAAALLLAIATRSSRGESGGLAGDGTGSTNTERLSGLHPDTTKSLEGEVSHYYDNAPGGFEGAVARAGANRAPVDGMAPLEFTRDDLRTPVGVDEFNPRLRDPEDGVTASIPGSGEPPLIGLGGGAYGKSLEHELSHAAFDSLPATRGAEPQPYKSYGADGRSSFRAYTASPGELIPRVADIKRQFVEAHPGRDVTTEADAEEALKWYGAKIRAEKSPFSDHVPGQATSHVQSWDAWGLDHTRFLRDRVKKLMIQLVHQDHGGDTKLAGLLGSAVGRLTSGVASSAVGGLGRAATRVVPDALAGAGRVAARVPAAAGQAAKFVAGVPASQPFAPSVGAAARNTWNVVNSPRYPGLDRPPGLAAMDRPLDRTRAATGVALRRGSQALGAVGTASTAYGTSQALRSFAGHPAVAAARGDEAALPAPARPAARVAPPVLSALMPNASAALRFAGQGARAIAQTPFGQQATVSGARITADVGAHAAVPAARDAMARSRERRPVFHGIADTLRSATPLGLAKTVAMRQFAHREPVDWGATLGGAARREVDRRDAVRAGTPEG